MMERLRGRTLSPGLRVILLLGTVALFGDIIYEGARSVTGPYIYILGGSMAAVGLAAGAGEFAGYALRLVSGVIADRTKQYWLIAGIGYGMLIAVPLLAFAGRWEVAALLVIAERIGKGIRSPAKDTILSNASAGMGRGIGFGIHEMLDQIGAFVGPLTFAVVFLTRGTDISLYREGFLLLTIPFVILIAVFLIAWKRSPDTEVLEAAAKGRNPEPPEFKRLIGPYGAFSFCTMAGFVLFPLLAFHAVDSGQAPEAIIPLLYALAMGTDALTAPLAGWIYDKKGVSVLYAIPICNCTIAPIAFLIPSLWAAGLAAAIWGLSMGVQETVLRAALGDLTHVKKRATAYGLFNTLYGAGLFGGNFLIGVLYDSQMVPAVLAFCVTMQGAAAVFLHITRGRVNRAASETVF